jgi:tellurite resistance protein TerC
MSEQLLQGAAAMQVNIWVWGVFGLIVLAALAIDLGLLRTSKGEDREVTLRSAAIRSAAWIAISLLFGLVVMALYGSHAAVTYLTAYLLEKSLSVDNIFVFLLIFSELRIPPVQQRRVLLWGVLSALVMRALLIGAGLFVINRFHWVVYPFAALIIFAAVRLVWGRQKERDMVVAACAICSTWVARVIPITPVFHGTKFWVRQGGRFVATPLLVALIIVETTDVVFALDSVPAVLAVTREPFLVYTSNIFAMLGLRALYFLLAGIVERFRYIRLGLAGILIFLGAKLLLGDIIEFPNWVSLAVIAVSLALSVAASLIWPGRSGQYSAKTSSG